MVQSMDEITVSAAQPSIKDGWPALSSVVTVAGRRFPVFVRANRGPLTTTSDPFLAAAIVPAMRLGLPLRVRGVVSAGLVRNMARLQDMLCAWFPDDMHRVDVDIEQTDNTRIAEDKRVASFFSGGVDSFYGALKHKQDIDDLVFIHGFDIPLDQTTFRAAVSDRLRAAAGELGHNLLEVETNIRTLLDPYADWNIHSHGCALGVVALALAPQLTRIYIGSTLSYDELRQHASHPLLDPLWGHQNLELIHDGCELSRWRKAERIIGNETVRRHLRVCWQVPRTAYNCGKCDGCRRVMLFLRATGWTDQCPAFPPIDLAGMTVKITNSFMARSYGDILTIAEEHNKDPELIARLRAALDDGHEHGITDLTPTSAETQRYEENLALKVDLRRARARLADMEQSRSWRLTAPLRALGRLRRRLPR